LKNHRRPGPGPPREPASADLGIPIAPRLGVWDAVSIIVGIVVGTAIFKSPTLVFQNVAGPWQGLGVWLLGGVLSLVGAFCYAELATTYPRSGGDYEYLTRAYGPCAGFLFGWAQLVAILTGSIAAMAYAFADYGARLWGLEPGWGVWLAAAAVVAITLANLAGIAAGKLVQNVLSLVKVGGLTVVVAAGLVWGQAARMGPGAQVEGAGLGLAMVFVLYAFGGWSDVAFIAAEVRGRRRNLPLALFLGIALVTAIYLLVNTAYLLVLGFEGARRTFTPASDLLGLAWGDWGAKGVGLLVMISALGAINGMVLTGSRIFASLGRDHGLFAWLARWNRRLGAPVGALLGQAAFALLLIFAVGTVAGRNGIDYLLLRLGLDGLPWERYFGGFATLVAGTAPVFWGFFLLTGISLFVLRLRDRGRQRPFCAPLYPLTPLLFCAMCLYMLYSSLDYAKALALIGLVPLALGLPLYWLGRRRKR
jgi:APA family basic amino acid/polyamine antiporter